MGCLAVEVRGTQSVQIDAADLRARYQQAFGEPFRSDGETGVRRPRDRRAASSASRPPRRSRAAGRSVLVLERHDGFARETTSRNSEVLHAGLYYPAGSLEGATLRGGARARSTRAAQREGIPHRRIGKLVVATAPAEIAALEACTRSAPRTARRVSRCSTPTTRAAHASRTVRAIAALHSPATGIVDAHALCLSFAAEAEAHGAALALAREVVAIESARPGYRVESRRARAASASRWMPRPS